MSGSAARGSNPARGQQPSGLLTKERRRRDVIRRNRRFLDIVREIYKRDMSVFTLNTNGWYITQEVLDELKAIGCGAKMKISFDGVGFHDWIRQREGAEKNALAAMELCLQNGFTVSTNTQVNRRNAHVMMPTAKLLDSIGVQGMRIIRTTDAPRWASEFKVSG